MSSDPTQPNPTQPTWTEVAALEMRCEVLIITFSRDPGITRMAQGPERTKDALQCVRAAVGEEGEEGEAEERAGDWWGTACPGVW